jgi:hypothetical protein
VGFLKPEISTLDVVEGVLPWAAPEDDEVRRCDAAAFAAGGLEPNQVLHEFFLLKAAMAGQYAMGLLESLGMKREGVEQFHQLYTAKLAEGLAATFKSGAQEAVTQMASRLMAYDKALHGGHPEDAHLAVADAFTRFCRAADQPELVSLCLDTCKALNKRFMDEVASLGSAPT